MHVTFEYSIKEDLRILYRIYRNPKEYKDLRSVIWNPFVIILFYLKRKRNLEIIKQRWTSIGPNLKETFKRNNIKIKKPVTCYITSVGPEGMFDPERNIIQVRYYKSYGWNEFVETVFHEGIHLAIYNKETYSYEEEEARVDKIMQKISSQN